MRLRYLAVSLLSLAAVDLGAQAKAQAGKSPELRVDFTRETLPNGLNVIYHVDHSAQIAAVLAERSILKIVRFLPFADPRVRHGDLAELTRETFREMLPIVAL